VSWSESPIGFYPTKKYDARRMIWENSREPIEWVDKQRRWLDHVFTRPFAYDEVWVIDIGKSGKTMIGAALAQWFGMFSDLPGEILLAANAREQSKVRTYKALNQSIALSPNPLVIDSTRTEVRWKSGNMARPVPLNAGTQAGSDALLITFDEVWNYTTDAALEMFAEAKSSPTMNVSMRVITTYPGYRQDDGPLNDMLKDFFDDVGDPNPGTERIPGLEDLPCYKRGTIFLWWNHEPYPWHLREVEGQTFLDRQRRALGRRPNEFKRIWQAQIVSREETFVHPLVWAKCEDDDWSPLPSTAQGVVGIIGVDIGVMRDSSAVVMRGLDPETLRIPLYDHKIWRPMPDPDRPGEPPEVRLKEVAQWILDRIRRHRILAVYYDPTQAKLMAQLLQEEIKMGGFSAKLVPVEQGKRRIEADMHYKDLIYAGELRNYPQSADLTQHVLDASARYISGGRFRIDKSQQGIHVDGAVADSQACLGVKEHQNDFLYTHRSRRPKRRPPMNHYREAFGMK
jgi:phage terminase large subunit-like protein